jgi:hypothetical protein
VPQTVIVTVMFDTTDYTRTAAADRAARLRADVAAERARPARRPLLRFWRRAA